MDLSKIPTGKNPPYDVYAKELTILGTALNPFTHLRAVGLLAELPLKVIQPGVFPLAAYADAFAAQHERREERREEPIAGRLRVVLRHRQTTLPGPGAAGGRAGAWPEPPGPGPSCGAFTLPSGSGGLTFARLNFSQFFQSCVWYGHFSISMHQAGGSESRKSSAR